MTRTSAAFLAALCISVAGCGSDTSERSSSSAQHAARDSVTMPMEGNAMVDVGGHQVYVRVIPGAGPPVVIEPGIGDASHVWEDVIARLRGEFTIVLCLRAGYGRSQPGPMPRTVERVATEMTRALEGSGVKPPYVVAGHSLGAIYALTYADEHPDRVKGLVLLDSPPLDFIDGDRFPNLQEMADSMSAGFRAEATRLRLQPGGREAGHANYYDAVASEHDQLFHGGGKRVRAIESLGDMPLVVMAAGVPNIEFGDSAIAFQEFWAEQSRDLTGLSSRSEFVYVDESTHDLPGEATDQVVAAIRRVAEME